MLNDTDRPVSPASVSSPRKRRALRVISAWTSAPERISRRARSAALYAATLPVTHNVILFPTRGASALVRSALGEDSERCNVSLHYALLAPFGSGFAWPGRRNRPEILPKHNGGRSERIRAKAGVKVVVQGHRKEL